MRVDFYALLRPLCSSGSASIDLPPGSNVKTLLATLMTEFPALRLHLIDDAGNLRQDVPLFVNGRNPRLAPDGLTATLPPDCVVSIFSPIASGKMNVEALRK